MCSSPVYVFQLCSRLNFFKIQDLVMDKNNLVQNAKQICT